MDRCMVEAFNDGAEASRPACCMLIQEAGGWRRGRRRGLRSISSERLCSDPSSSLPWLSPIHPSSATSDSDRYIAMAEMMSGFTSPLCLLLLLLVASIAFAPVARAAEMEMELVPVEEEDGPSSSSSCAEPVSVEAACRGASESHAGVTYDHCVASLGADPRSKEAEAGSMHGLAVLATRMAADHAASTESKIEDLSELEESPHARARFNHCLELYGGAADLLRDALDNLKAKIYGKAMEQLSAALGASESCEDAWKGQESTGIPVAEHDREYGRMAHIALGFTHAAA